MYIKGCLSWFSVFEFVLICGCEIVKFKIKIFLPEFCGFLNLYVSL